MKMLTKKVIHFESALIYRTQVAASYMSIKKLMYPQRGKNAMTHV